MFLAASGRLVELDLLDQLGEIDGLDIQLHLAGLDLGDIQDVVDHGQQVLSGSADLLQIGDLLAASFQFGIFQQDFAVAEHGIQRRPQFVAHLGQEVRLGTVGALGVFLGVRQHLHGALMPVDLLQQFGLRIHDARIVARHQEHVGCRAEGRDDADADHLLHRDVRRETSSP